MFRLVLDEAPRRLVDPLAPERRAVLRAAAVLAAAGWETPPVDAALSHAANVGLKAGMRNRWPLFVVVAFPSGIVVSVGSPFE